MVASFNIAVMAARNLLSVELAGFFSPDDVRQFAAAQMLASQQLTCAANQHVTIVDVREMQIQSQDTVVAFQSMLANPRGKGRAIAFVVSRSLARMQAQRVAAGREANFFGSVEEATVWLCETSATAA